MGQGKAGVAVSSRTSAPDSPQPIMHLCKRAEMCFFWKKGIYARYSLSECSDFYMIRPPTTQVCLLST